MRATPRLPDPEVNVSEINPLREAGVLVAGISLVGALIFLLLAGFVDVAARLVPIETEVRFLGGLVERFGDSWRDTEDLDELTGRLAARWEDNPYEFRVGILEAEMPNALALPGGVILVTSGLLERVESENALAFVLAHEIGHFAGRDHLRSLGRGVLFSLLLGAVGIGAGNAADAVVNIGALLGDRSFSRYQEEDADVFALALVHAEYGHVGGSTHFFERLLEEDDRVVGLVEGFVSTHPLGEQRIETLHSLAAARGWSEEGELRPRRGALPRPQP